MTRAKKQEGLQKKPTKQMYPEKVSTIQEDTVLLAQEEQVNHKTKQLDLAQATQRIQTLEYVVQELTANIPNLVTNKKSVEEPTLANAIDKVNVFVENADNWK